MVKSGDKEMEHRVKQKKRKNLPNTMVYGSINKTVEMHELGEYEVENEKLKTHILNLIEENIIVNNRLNKTKDALQTLLTKIENIERKMKTYGLE